MDPLLRLAELLDPVALCAFVGKKTRHGARDAGTFKHAQAFLKQYPSAEWAQVEPLLTELGAYNDAEIGYNICTRLDELPADLDERYGYTKGSDTGH